MNITKMLAAGSAVALAATLGTAAVPANAAKGDTPLASVIQDNKDFDVLYGAVTAVLADNPDSDVRWLTNGSVKLTAFAPTDKAFKNLATTISGTKVKSDTKALNTIAEAVGIDGVESVLLYHVVPGKPITAKKALKSNGAKLETAQGGTVKVKVKKKHSSAPVIRLKDKDPELKNPKVVVADVNKGNKQIAHAIDNVLLPIQVS